MHRWPIFDSSHLVQTSHTKCQRTTKKHTLSRDRQTSLSLTNSARHIAYLFVQIHRKLLPRESFWKYWLCVEQSASQAPPIQNKKMGIHCSRVFEATFWPVNQKGFRQPPAQSDRVRQLLLIDGGVRLTPPADYKKKNTILIFGLGVYPPGFYTKMA